MISKIHWSDISEKGNPFGGVDGFRPIRITFHSGSFTNIDDENQKSLDILTGLASLDDIDAMSFDGSISPKIIIDYETLDRNNIGLRVINSEGKAFRFSGISNSWIQPNFIGL